jgi:hypothetical protein
MLLAVAAAAVLAGPGQAMAYGGRKVIESMTTGKHSSAIMCILQACSRLHWHNTGGCRRCLTRTSQELQLSDLVFHGAALPVCSGCCNTRACVPMP